MLPSRTLPVFFDHGGRRCSVRVSFEPAEKLVVLVHGFAGDPATTWGLLPDRLGFDAHAGPADLISYGYDSLNLGVTQNGRLLREFVTWWQEEGAEATLGRHRPGPYAYREILLVAHSMGAVVARRALLDDYRGKNRWARRARLILFAPAHRGARVHELLRESFLLWRFFKFKVPSLADLEPESRALVELANMCRDELAKGHRDNLNAALVRHAQHDAVVVTEDFLTDPAASVSVGQSHASVCKPAGDYDDPTTDVGGLL